MFWRCSLTLIVIYVTAASSRATTKGREYAAHQENLKFEANNLSLAKPFLEYPLVEDDIFTENIEVGENGNEPASLDDLNKLYEKDNAIDKDLPRYLKRVKRQYNGQVYGDILTGYSNYQKTLMQNYLPAAMPNYFSYRQGKQLAFPEQAPTSGNAYLNNPLDYSIQHNIENTYMSPENNYDYVAKPNENLPLNLQDYQDYAAKTNENIPMVSQDYPDYSAKPNESVPLDFQDYPDYVSKPNKNIPLDLQDYRDYYDPQEYGDPISNDYYDDYMAAYQDYLSNYAADKQLDKDLFGDKPIINPPGKNQDIDSQGITQQENAETMDENTQIDSPLEESNIDEYTAYENGDVLSFAEDHIGLSGNDPGKKEEDKLEDDKIEKVNGNKREYDDIEYNEKNENEEVELANPDRKEDDSVTRKGGARVFSIDPEGRISDTGLGDEDVKRLIHQVTDIKEGRNLAFMQKFEGLIQKMLN